MRSYMPGPHRRFLQDVSSVANIRDYVESHRLNHTLSVAFDACLFMLRSLRDKHIRLVSRYIIVKSRESRSHARSFSPRSAPNNQPEPLNIASASTHKTQRTDNLRAEAKKLRGTGGTALIPFLKQARDETGEPAIDAWARRILSNGPPELAGSPMVLRWGRWVSMQTGSWRLWDWQECGGWMTVREDYVIGE